MPKPKLLPSFPNNNKDGYHFLNDYYITAIGFIPIISKSHNNPRGLNRSHFKDRKSEPQKR